jgi:putative inorganic carbon (HCO3(-)) transporter
VFLILASPLFLFPRAAWTPALLLVPLFWCARRWSRGYFVEPTPLNVPIALLALMVLVSLYATFDMAYSLPKIAGMVLGMGAFFALVGAAFSPRAWILAALLFLLLGLGVAGLGLLGTAWIHKFAVLEPLLALVPARIAGLPGAAEGFHPNEVAGALLWVTPFALTAALAALGNFKPLCKKIGRAKATGALTAILLSATVLTGVLVLTQSRGGWIAAALTFPLLVVLFLRGRARLALALAVVVLVAGGAIWIGTAHPDSLRTLVLGPTEDPARGLSLENLSVRVEIWSRAIYGIEDFSITGMGMNNFRRILPVLYPLFSIGPEADIGHAHNTFLQAALDLGIPGLIAYLAIHISAFAMLIATWLRRAQLPFPEPLSRALILGLGGGLAAHLIYGLTDAVALGAKPGVLWWMLLGLVASLYRGPALRKETRPKPEDRSASLLRAPR